MDDTGFGSNRMAKLITFAGEDRHGRNDNTTKLGEVCWVDNTEGVFV